MREQGSTTVSTNSSTTFWLTVLVRGSTTASPRRAPGAQSTTWFPLIMPAVLWRIHYRVAGPTVAVASFYKHSGARAAVPLNAKAPPTPCAGAPRKKSPRGRDATLCSPIPCKANVCPAEI